MLSPVQGTRAVMNKLCAQPSRNLNHLMGQVNQETRLQGKGIQPSFAGSARKGELTDT